MNVFICLTPLHFYFSFSMAKKLYEKEKGKSYIIVKGNYTYEKSFLPYISTIYIQNDSFLHKVAVKLKYDIFWNYSSIKKILNKDIKRLVIFNFNDPITKHSLNCISDSAEVIYCEEGIGSWSNEWSGGYIPERVNVALMGEKEIFEKAHNEFSGTVYPLIYNEVFNSERSLEFLNCVSKFKGAGEMPFLYLGTVDQDNLYNAEKDALRKIASSLPKDAKLYIKKHPRDTKNRYKYIAREFDNISIVSDELQYIPVECISWSFNIKYVFSIFSTGSFYLPKVKPTVKSIFLFDFELFQHNLGDAISEKDYAIYRRLIEKDDNMFLPSNISELKKIMSN